METYGKKQIDIREDNKSAVIDILLKEEATLLQMSEKLKLSHTALAKVIKELMQKNVVRLTDCRAVNTGRPPKLYGINGECAIACAAVITPEKVYVYYIDMHGFQVNEKVCGNTFSDLEETLTYIVGQIRFLKAHPRLTDKIFKFLYVGIPSAQFFGRTFSRAQKEVSERFEREFPEVHTVVRRNIDYETVAETKYGLLKADGQNAVLLNFDNYVSASLLLGGEIYAGDRNMQGLLEAPDFQGIEGLSETIGDFSAFAESYLDGEAAATELVREKLGGVLCRLREIIRFLDVREILLSGKVKRLGEPFLQYVREAFGEEFRVRYSVMGKDVPPSLSGAVWLSAYSTLQEIMTR